MESAALSSITAVSRYTIKHLVGNFVIAFLGKIMTEPLYQERSTGNSSIFLQVEII